MALDSQCVGSGVPPQAVNALTGTYAGNLVATGTNVGTALQLQAAYNHIGTTASGTGAVMPQTQNTTPGDEVSIFNGGANPLTLYPYGVETFIGGASTFSLPAGKSVLCWKALPGLWVTNLSA